MSKRLVIGGRAIEVSRPDKVLFPSSGMTKADLAEYYLRIAPVMTHLIKDRPLTVQRFPDGIGEEGFFQKDSPDHLPSWITTKRLPKQDGDVDYVLANDATTLVYLADQAMITPHIGLSRVDDVERPDRIVFDLDPPDHDFSTVRFAALKLRDAIDDLGLKAFAQTTGSRGLHVIVPIRRELRFDDVRAFARQLAQRLARAHRERLTVEQRKAKRGNRVFLDVLRNAYGQTAVAPYGVRAIEGAPVATPVDWYEVERASLRPQAFTVRNMFRRLGHKDCPWRTLTRHARALAPAIDRLESAAC